MEKDLAGLIGEITKIREELEQLVEGFDPGKEIHPGWKLRETICHITAWEIVIDKALKAYQLGAPPYFLPEQDFDIFNDEAVSCRDDLSLEGVLKEWRDVREELLGTIQKLKEEDLAVEMVLPWGSERTVAELIEIIGEHETEHMEEAARLA